MGVEKIANGSFSKLSRVPWISMGLVIVSLMYSLLVGCSHVYFLVMINYVFRYCKLFTVWIGLIILTLINMITLVVYNFYPWSRICKKNLFQKQEEYERIVNQSGMGNVNKDEDLVRKKRIKKIVKYVLIFNGYLICILVNIFVFSLSCIVLFLQVQGSILLDGNWAVGTGKITANIGVSREYAGEVHLLGENDLDVIFAQGFVHAQDRFAQMEISRHTAHGRLSEMIGTPGINFDYLSRTIGIHNTSCLIYKNLPIHYRKELDAYALGVNSYLETQRQKLLPLELQILGYYSFSDIEKWSPIDSISIELFRHFKLSENYRYEHIRLLYQTNGYSYEDIERFFPKYNLNNPTIKESFESVNIDNDGEIPFEKENIFTAKKGSIIREHRSTMSAENNNNFNGILRVQNDQSLWNRIVHKAVSYVIKYSGYTEHCIGNIVKDLTNVHKLSHDYHSNAWVIHSSKTISGKSMLVNDPHGRMHFTNGYYMNHLHSKSDNGLNVIGASVPGIPGIIVGRNEHISFGLTSSMADVMDLYILDQNQEGDSYLYRGKYHRYFERKELIRVKNSESIQMSVKYTHLGEPLFYILESDSKSNSNSQGIVLRWSVQNVNNSGRIALSKLMHAKNWDDFLNAMKYYEYSPCNYVFADEHNIGWLSVGKIPLRNKNHTGKYAMYNSHGGNNWEGFVPFENMPKLYNPERGYIVNANNKITVNDNHMMGYDFAPGLRAKRISEFLEHKIKITKLTFQHMKQLQIDVKSQLFLEIRYIFQYLDYLDIEVEDELKQVIKWLGDFEGDLSEDTVIPTVFEVFWQTFRSYIPPLYEGFEYKKLAPFIMNTLEEGYNISKPCKLIHSGHNITNNCSSIVVKLLRKILKDGSLSSIKPWDEVHYVLLSHDIFGSEEIGVLGCLYNTLLKSNGDDFTVNTGSPYPEVDNFNAFNAEFSSQQGAIWRMIIDMNGLDNNWFIYPNGQSTEIYSPLLDNLMDKWIKKTYEKMAMTQYGTYHYMTILNGD